MFVFGFACLSFLLVVRAQQQNGQMGGARGPGIKMEQGCLDTPPTLREARRQCGGGMLIPRFYFNTTSQQCVMRRECFYMRTGMRSMMECNKECVCMQPALAEGTGGGAMCEKEVMRWMYVGERCVQQMFAGCGGNGNNFRTRRECLRKCKPREPEMMGLMGEVPGEFAEAMALSGGNRGWGGSPGGWGGSPGGWGNGGNQGRGNRGGGGPGGRRGGRRGGGRGNQGRGNGNRNAQRGGGGGGGGGNQGQGFNNQNAQRGGGRNMNQRNRNQAGRGGGGGGGQMNYPPSPTRPTITTAPVTRPLPSVRKITPKPAPAQWNSNVNNMQGGTTTVGGYWGGPTTTQAPFYNPYNSLFLHEFITK